MKIRLLKGIFTILLIATIVTIFELLFYLFVVEPIVKTQINQLISALTVHKLDNKIEKFLDIIIERENALISSINTGSYIIIIVEILLLSSTLFYIYLLIQRLCRKIDIKVDITETIINSSITILILIAYQVQYFYFGQKFLYPGVFGLEEIQARIIINLDNSLNLL